MMIDIAPPTLAQGAKMNELQAQYTQLVAENATLMNLVIELMSPGNISTLLTENSDMTRELHSALGSQAHNFRPLISRVDKTKCGARLCDDEEDVIFNLATPHLECLLHRDTKADVMVDASAEDGRKLGSQLNNRICQSNIINDESMNIAAEMGPIATFLANRTQPQRVRRNVNGSVKAKRRNVRAREAAAAAALAVATAAAAA